MDENTDIQYEVGTLGVKENIILHKKPNKHLSYKYFVQADNLFAVLNEDSSIAFFAKDDEETPLIFQIPPAYMIDNNGMERYAIKTELEKTETGYLLTYIPDNEWLRDKTRAYPVTIDPTSTLRNVAESAYVYSASSYQNTNLGWEQQLKVGSDTYTGNGTYYTYVKFPNSSLPWLGTSYEVYHAELNLRQKEFNASFPVSIGAYEVLTSWQEHGTQGITWNNRGVTSEYPVTYAYAYASDQWNWWDITNTVKDWCNSLGTNYGIKLGATNTSTGTRNHVVFHSTRTTASNSAPCLTIYYNLKDNESDNPKNATQIELNNLNNGYISHGEDIDWFRFQTTTAGNYIIDASGIDTVGYLYDSGNTNLEIASNDIVGAGFQIVKFLEAEKDYYIRVIASDQQVTNNGSYSLYISPPEHISNVTYQSAHPYANSTHTTQTISAPSGTTKMRLHFAYIDTERFYDYVSTSGGDSWSGHLTNVWTEWCYDSTMQVIFDSDASITGDGYLVDKIEYYYNTESNWKTIENYNLSFDSNTSTTKYWEKQIPGAKAIRVHFKDIDICTGNDKLKVWSESSDVYPDLFHGSRSGVWSSWFTGNRISLEFQDDSTLNLSEFEIDKIEYMTDTISDFPWKDYQFSDTVINPNPYFGDAGRRLADRLNHLPSSGSIEFQEKAYDIYYDSQERESRSFKLNFSWTADRLRNLVQDGNETYELEVDFYGFGVPDSDPYGRPLEAFMPWLLTIGSEEAFNKADGPNDFTRYEDDWYSIFPSSQWKRGTYFYRTNLPSEAAYPDTLYPDTRNTTLCFCVGISDAQYLQPDTAYYYEIIGQKGEGDNGIFSIVGQRGYKYDKDFLPSDRVEFTVFNEESECLSVDNRDVLMKSPSYHLNDTPQQMSNNNFRLDAIISTIDARYDTNILVADHKQFQWDQTGRIYYRANAANGWSQTNITRNWDLWNTSWFNNNMVKGSEG